MTSSDTINQRNSISGMDTSENIKSYFEWCSKLYDFSTKYNQILFDASNESIRSYFGSKWRSDRPEKIRNFIRKEFDSTLQEKLYGEEISQSLTETVDSWLNFLRISRLDRAVSAYSKFLAVSTKIFEPVRDNVDRTTSETIRIKGGFDIHHYYYNNNNNHRKNNKKQILHHLPPCLSQNLLDWWRIWKAKGHHFWKNNYNNK